MVATALTSGIVYYVKVSTTSSGTCTFNLAMRNSLMPPACNPGCGLVSNPSFEANSYASNPISPFESFVNCWYRAGSSPQISNGVGSGSSTYSAYMSSGSSSTSEQIYANVNIISGHKYVLNYFLKKSAANTVDNFYVKLVNSSGGGWTPGNSSTIISPSIVRTISQNTAISSTSWAEYTVCFTATTNYDILYCYPQCNSGNFNEWVNFDQVQITELTVDAGSDLSLSCTGSGTIGSVSCTPILGATYSWSPTSGLTSPTSASTTINPVYSSQSYTVTATAGACSVTDVVVVSTGSGTCSGSVVYSVAIGNTNPGNGTNINGTTVAINDDILISSGTVTISSDDVRILTGKKITVRTGATLIVDGAWLHACNPCGAMWYGIVLESGAALQIINGSLIEDATNAVLTTAGGSAPIYTINQAIFNRNTIAIKVMSNSNSLNSNVIKNTIITCRALPAPSGLFTTYFSNVKSALTGTSYATALTLDGSRSSEGIEFNDISNSFPAVIGDASSFSVRNIFDNLDYGVYLNSARVNVKNSQFQYMSGYQPVIGHGAIPPPTGIAIYAPAQTFQLYSILNIGASTGFYEPCLFYDCWRGVDVSGYREINAFNNEFSCSAVPAVPPTSSAYIGNAAIWLKDIKEGLEINGNYITDWITGVRLTRNSVTGGTNNPPIKIRNNTISADVNGHCDNAIYLSDVLANTLTTITTIYINANEITDVNNGIRASHIKNNLIIYDHSILELRYNSSGTYSGIMLEGCDKAEVKNNTINSLRGAYGNSDNWEMRGIYATASTNNKIYCNTLSSLGECMVFEGTCLSATASGYGIKSNSMDNARTGLMLRTSGIIGTQGSTSSPNGNSWNNSFTFDKGRTYAYSTTNANSASILYCTNTASTLPPLGTNLTNGVGGTEYFTGGVGGLITATGSPISCPTAELPSGMTVQNNGIRSMAIENDYTEQLKVLLESATSADNLYPTQQWNMRNFIFNEIRSNSDLQQDSVLNAFYTSNQNSAYELFAGITDAIGNGDYPQATAYNGNVSPVCTAEENQKLFNQIFLSHTDSLSAYTEEDIESLYTIANQCAIDGGNAVYQSRNLLMLIMNDVISFADNCAAAQGINNNASAFKTPEKVSTGPAEVKLYPNPNNGEMILECNLQDQESGNLIIYSLTGKILKNLSLSVGTKTLTINAEELQAGMYLYEVRINGKESKKNKLTIIK
jgi:hypothetical protein